MFELDLKDNTWVQRDTDLDLPVPDYAEDFGSFVDLSDGGSAFAVGDRQFRIVDVVNSSVSVFQYDGNIWGHKEIALWTLLTIR